MARRRPAERVGSVAGIVGAAGGLGGFFPPLVMGATYDEADHSYTIGLMLLCVTAVVALLFTLFGMRKRRLPAPGRRSTTPPEEEADGTTSGCPAKAL